MSALLRSSFQRLTCLAKATVQLPKAMPLPAVSTVTARPFHSSKPASGWDEFLDPVGDASFAITAGRGWTCADLRRKSKDDLQKLWYVLYKERNVLLTNRMRLRKALNPVSDEEERRYTQVKRSMAAVKRVVAERKRIDALLRAQEEAAVGAQQPQA